MTEFLKYYLILTYLSCYFLTYILTCLLTYLLYYLLTQILTFLLIYLLTYPLSYLLSYLLTYLPLSKLPIVCCIFFRGINRNEKTNKCLLAGGKSLPEVHLRLPRFTYSACGFKERMQQFRETKDLKPLYRKELDKNFFQHELTEILNIYLEEQSLIKHLILRDKAFIIAKKSQYDGYNLAVASMSYDFLIKGLLI